MDDSPSGQFTRLIFNCVIVQLSKAVGYESVSSLALGILTDVVNKYMKEICNTIRRYSELCGHSDITLQALSFVFRDMNIDVQELEDYIKNFEAVPLGVKIPEYPMSRESTLNFLKPGSKEVLTRPMHIHEHLPPMYPEDSSDNENLPQCPSTSSGMFNMPRLDDLNFTRCPGILSAGSEQAIMSLFSGETNNADGQSSQENKRFSVRELRTIMMTSAGFITPSVEGKLPQSRIPHIIDFTHFKMPFRVPHKKSTVSCGSKKSKKSITKMDLEMLKMKRNLEEPQRLVEKVNVKSNKMKLELFGRKDYHNTLPEPHLKAMKSKKNKIRESTGSIIECGSKKLALEESHTYQNEASVSDAISGKLTTQPDKQKINILKKITKMKDDKSKKSIIESQVKKPTESSKKKDICPITKPHKKHSAPSETKESSTSDVSLMSKTEKKTKPHFPKHKQGIYNKKEIGLNDDDKITSEECTAAFANKSVLLDTTPGENVSDLQCKKPRKRTTKRKHKRDKQGEKSKEPSKHDTVDINTEFERNKRLQLLQDLEISDDDSTTNQSPTPWSEPTEDNYYNKNYDVPDMGRAPTPASGFSDLEYNAEIELNVKNYDSKDAFGVDKQRGENIMERRVDDGNSFTKSDTLKKKRGRPKKMPDYPVVVSEQSSAERIRESIDDDDDDDMIMIEEPVVVKSHIVKPKRGRPTKTDIIHKKYQKELEDKYLTEPSNVKPYKGRTNVFQIGHERPESCYLSDSSRDSSDELITKDRSQSEICEETGDANMEYCPTSANYMQAETTSPSNSEIKYMSPNLDYETLLGEISDDSNDTDYVPDFLRKPPKEKSKKKINTNKKRGRPKKVISTIPVDNETCAETSELLGKESSATNEAHLVPKKRGRPRKIPLITLESTNVTDTAVEVISNTLDMETEVSEVVSRKRGRPRKYPLPQLKSQEKSGIEIYSDSSSVEPVHKSKRGRPKKCTFDAPKLEHDTEPGYDTPLLEFEFQTKPKMEIYSDSSSTETAHKSKRGRPKKCLFDTPKLEHDTEPGYDTPLLQSEFQENPEIDIYSDSSSVEPVHKSKHGRPKKYSDALKLKYGTEHIADHPLLQLEFQEKSGKDVYSDSSSVEPVYKSKRGRPKKSQFNALKLKHGTEHASEHPLLQLELQEKSEKELYSDCSSVEHVHKSKRGRPKKYQFDSLKLKHVTERVSDSGDPRVNQKRRRGRPKKCQSVIGVENLSELKIKEQSPFHEQNVQQSATIYGSESGNMYDSESGTAYDSESGTVYGTESDNESDKKSDTMCEMSVPELNFEIDENVATGSSSLFHKKCDGVEYDERQPLATVKPAAMKMKPITNPSFTFVPPVSLQPGLIPSYVANSPLYSCFPLPGTKSKTSAHPAMPDLPLPPPSLMQAQIRTLLKSPSLKSNDILGNNGEKNLVKPTAALFEGTRTPSDDLEQGDVILKGSLSVDKHTSDSHDNLVSKLITDDGKRHRKEHKKMKKDKKDRDKRKKDKKHKSKRRDKKEKIQIKDTDMEPGNFLDEEASSKVDLSSNFTSITSHSMMSLKEGDFMNFSSSVTGIPNLRVKWAVPNEDPPSFKRPVGRPPKYGAALNEGDDATSYIKDCNASLISPLTSMYCSDDDEDDNYPTYKKYGDDNDYDGCHGVMIQNRDYDLSYKKKFKKSTLYTDDSSDYKKKSVSSGKKKDKTKIPKYYYYDEEGHKIWVCPTCNVQDNGTPMIGCDGCEAWYHWVCMGIEAPPISHKWFCPACTKKHDLQFAI